MTSPAPDPKPRPPSPPAPEDCCRSGCNPCVFDLYEADLRQYERELAAWEARQGDATTGRKTGRKSRRERLS
jgi:hypothetical protein